MILGVDHVAFETLNFERTISQFEDLGFAAAFIERNIPNPKEKRPFLAAPAATHSIALLRKAGSAAVEVTHHVARVRPPKRRFSPSARGLCAVASRLRGSGSRTAAAVRPARRERGEFSRIGGAASTTWNLNPESGLREIEISTSNWTRTHRFWCEGLGWTVASGVDDELPPTRERGPSADSSATLQRKSLIDEWSLSVVVRFDRERRLPAMLDEPGWTCAAMISSDLEGDLSRLMEYGAAGATPPFEFTAGGRRLRIALLRGPGGEIVELIELS